MEEEIEMEIVVRGLESAAVEEHAVTLMWEYHTAKWEEMPEVEVERRRAAYLSYVGGSEHDPLREAS